MDAGGEHGKGHAAKCRYPQVTNSNCANTVHASLPLRLLSTLAVPYMDVRYSELSVSRGVHGRGSHQMQGRRPRGGQEPRLIGICCRNGLKHPIDCTGPASCLTTGVPNRINIHGVLAI